MTLWNISPSQWIPWSTQMRIHILRDKNICQLLREWWRKRGWWCFCALVWDYIIWGVPGKERPASSRTVALDGHQESWFPCEGLQFQFSANLALVLTHIHDKHTHAHISHAKTKTKQKKHSHWHAHAKTQLKTLIRIYISKKLSLSAFPLFFAFKECSNASLKEHEKLVTCRWWCCRALLSLTPSK